MSASTYYAKFNDTILAFKFISRKQLLNKQLKEVQISTKADPSMQVYNIW